MSAVAEAPKKPASYYQRTIAEQMELMREGFARKGRLNVIPRDFDPRWVEAWMRLEFKTLDHLPLATFVTEIGNAIACERAEPGSGESLALSMGL